MKDHDVTWLYGPLQSGQVLKLGPASPSPTTRLSRTDSFVVAKKSILKKRSLSETMLQRSLSNSTLVKQAVDSIVSQGPHPSRIRPALSPRSVSEMPQHGQIPFATPVETPLRTLSSSSSSSGAQTPNVRRHIHFSEKVEQCIAINKDGEDEHDEELDSGVFGDSDGESDDGVLMMRPEKGKERRLSSSDCRTPRQSFSSDASQRTIAMLPATKLRGDTPEPPEVTDCEAGFWNLRGSLAKSSSQETLKPSRPSSNFLKKGGDTDNHHAQLPFSSTSRPTSKALHSTTSTHFTLDEDKEMESRGLRRTPSGMFMPYDESLEGYETAGLFGKVIDTVNTAKDVGFLVDGRTER